MEKRMVKAFCFLQMEANMKDLLVIMKYLAMASIIGMMEKFILVNG